jgi:hypothetical protein
MRRKETMTSNADSDWMYISEPDALRLSIAHTLLHNGEYDGPEAVRRDIIMWAHWLGRDDIIPVSWNPTGSTWGEMSPNQAMGLWQEVPMPPFSPADMSNMSAQELQDAAMHYIDSKYGKHVTMAVERKLDQHIPADIVKQQAAAYDKMVHRNADGSDPLVQEP